MKLRLIRGASYTDLGSITATAKSPFVDTDDIEKAQNLIDEGIFEAVEETAPDKSRGTAEGRLPYKKDTERSAVSDLKSKLEAMNISELRKYAADHGVTVKASKKDDIIEKLMEADARAQEARESLRGE